MSSGMAVITVLLLAAWVLCSQSASSLMADCLTFRVLAFTDCLCRSAAAVRPLLYRWLTSWRDNWGPVGVLAGVAHSLEYSCCMLFGSSSRGTCKEQTAQPLNIGCLLRKVVA